MNLHDVCKAIELADGNVLTKAKSRLDQLTKPVGSLGRLEELAAWYAAVTGQERPSPPKAMVLTLAADHGVASEGVSAYPSSVTAQMVHNFVHGGAAVNVLARHVGADTRVVDIGVASDLEKLPGLVKRKVALGTNNFTRGPAMTHEQALQAIDAGISLAYEAHSEGVGLIGVGDMGIGNTTASSAVTSLITGHPVEDVTGRGTGVDDRSFHTKIDVIKKSIEVNSPDSHNPIDILAKVGGFEIGGIVGVILGASAQRVPVVLDGFITSVGAILAVSLQPRCRDYLMASHLSVEPGHKVLLEQLGLRPLLDLDLRLGEGTGACLGIGLLQAAIKMFTQMATFEEAQVDQAFVEELKQQ